MRVLKAIVVLAVIVGFSAPAFAQQRGLGGIYTKRNMTQAPGSLKIIAGPESPQLLGLTLGDVFTSGFDGGVEIINPSISFDEGDGPETDTIINANIGAVYGVTDALEFGAMFAPLRFSGPEGQDDVFQNVPVWGTYGVDMGNFDIGVRLTGIIPIVDEADFTIVPGIPILFRGNGFRLDAGLFAPITFASVQGLEGEETETLINLNIPIRPAFQVTPNVYAGVETGLTVTGVSGPEGIESQQLIPLGVFVGYTLVAGARVIDIAASLAFDNALFVSAEEPISTAQFSWLRVNVGANVALKF